jgi:glutamate racemase
MNGVIGVFDSGIGGLTVARELASRFPAEEFVYLGDTARLPYGSKSPETVRSYAVRCTAFLARFPLKTLVVACNTVSSMALPNIAGMVSVPVLGVIEPGAATAVRRSVSGRIGVIGQPVTINSGAYEQAIKRLRPEAVVTSAVSPLLVPLAEEGWMGSPVVRLVLERYLAPVLAADVDSLVLGCTHYPLFKADIAAVTRQRGLAVELVDSASAVADELERLINAGLIKRRPDGGQGSIRCFVTDSPASFASVGARFWGAGFGAIEQVDL